MGRERSGTRCAFRTSLPNRLRAMGVSPLTSTDARRPVGLLRVLHAPRRVSDRNAARRRDDGARLR